MGISETLKSFANNCRIKQTQLECGGPIQKNLAKREDTIYVPVNLSLTQECLSGRFILHAEFVPRCTTKTVHLEFPVNGCNPVYMRSKSNREQKLEVHFADQTTREFKSRIDVRDPFKSRIDGDKWDHAYTHIT